MKISELFAEIGFKVDTIKLREVTKLIGDLNISSIIGATSLVALGEGIKGLVNSSAAASSALLTLQANTGINTDFAQQFEKASLALGSSKESADALINSLSKIKAGLNLPGGQVPYGLRLMGFTKDDFQGSIEDNIKTIITRLSKSKPAANASQAAQEQWKGLISNVAQSFGTTPEQLKVLINPELMGTMHEMLTMSHEDLLANQEATKEWSTLVQNINTEFEIMVSKWLPELTAGLKEFKNDGGLKGLLDSITVVSKVLEMSLKGWGLIFGSAGLSRTSEGQRQYWHTSAWNHKHPEGIAWNSGNKGVRDVNVHSQVTIHSSDPKGVVQEIEAWWKKTMTKSMSEFGLGQT